MKFRCLVCHRDRFSRRHMDLRSIRMGQLSQLLVYKLGTTDEKLPHWFTHGNSQRSRLVSPLLSRCSRDCLRGYPEKVVE